MYIDAEKPKPLCFSVSEIIVRCSVCAIFPEFVL